MMGLHSNCDSKSEPTVLYYCDISTTTLLLLLLPLCTLNYTPRDLTAAPRDLSAGGHDCRLSDKIDQLKNFELVDQLSSSVEMNRSTSWQIHCSHFHCCSEISPHHSQFHCSHFHFLQSNHLYLGNSSSG